MFFKKAQVAESFVGEVVQAVVAQGLPADLVKVHLAEVLLWKAKHEPALIVAELVVKKAFAQIH